MFRLGPGLLIWVQVVSIGLFLSHLVFFRTMKHTVSEMYVWDTKEQSVESWAFKNA